MARFVIVGPGAIGGVIGAQLARASVETVLIARGEHAAALQKTGLQLQHGDETEIFVVPTVTRPDEIAWRHDDVVILAVKSQDTEPALRSLALVAAPSTSIVCAQNGVDNERAAQRYFETVYGCVVMMPAAHLEPGVVQAHSWPVPGLLDVGRYPSGADAGAEEIVATFNRAGFNCVVREDVMRWKYTKLLMNLANSVIALCGSGGDDSAELRRSVRDEGEAVLKAAGIDYASREEDLERRADIMTIVPIGGMYRTGGSSWQSLARGTGAIETDWLNGEIVALGRRHSVPTPVNAVLQRAANQAARDGLPPESIPASEILASL
ncbi:MAG: 2-dehydropantoate 2-reductase [Actinomycetota bacterium]|jgi:2-dehydropantoate 2-reductase